MKKLFVTGVLLVACLLAGCGSKKAMNVQEVSGRLLKEIAYQDELGEVDLDTAGMFLNLSDIAIKEAAIYETSGWTAEEIVVLECESSDDVAKAKSMMEARVAEQTSNYADYVPEELDKLGKAVIVTSGNYAILSVSNEADTAKKIISEYE